MPRYMTRAQTRRWRRLRRTGWICVSLAILLLLFFLPMILSAGRFSAWVWLFSAGALLVLSVAGVAFTFAGSIETDIAPPLPVTSAPPRIARHRSAADDLLPSDIRGLRSAAVIEGRRD
jgi:hypothetical protein